MGLDMYFYAVSESENGRPKSQKAAIYWRKANAILRWLDGLITIWRASVLTG